MTTNYLLPNCHPPVADGFAAGGPIVLVARNSTASGRRGREQAALDFTIAVRRLYELGIADVRGVVPTREEVLAALTATVDMERIGTKRWSYFEWVSPDAKVHALICAGSGKMVDLDGVQPFMRRTHRLVRSRRPALLFAKEMDRFGRDEIGLVQIARALDMIEASDWPSYIGDGLEGIVLKYPGWQDRLYQQASQSRRQATSFEWRSREAQAEHTGSTMVEGRVRFATAPSVPPGLGLTRLAGGDTANGIHIAYLDSPRYRPNQAELHVQLRPALDAHSEPADQVALVRFALQSLADGSSPADVAAVLHAGGFSTTGLQRLHNRSDATYLSEHNELTPSLIRNMIRAITDQLTFYETGEYRVRINGSTHVIQGCLPEGGWATPEVFAQLRSRRGMSGVPTPRTRSSLGGLPVTVLGTESTLQMESQSCTCIHTPDDPTSAACSPRYALKARTGQNFRADLQHGPFMTSVVEALAAAFEAGEVRLAPPQVPDDVHYQAALAELSTAERARAVAQGKLDTLAGNLAAYVSDERMRTLIREQVALCDKELEQSNARVIRAEIAVQQIHRSASRAR